MLSHSLFYFYLIFVLHKVVYGKCKQELLNSLLACCNVKPLLYMFRSTQRVKTDCVDGTYKVAVLFDAHNMMDHIKFVIM
jgi:hypothetical protein